MRRASGAVRRFASSAPDAVDADVGGIAPEARGRLLAEAKARKLRLRNLQRHIFVCHDPERNKCCAQERSNESWLYLKRRLKELGMASEQEGGYVARSKAPLG